MPANGRTTGTGCAPAATHVTASITSGNSSGKRFIMAP
jgi:hypothetical protein